MNESKTPDLGDSAQDAGLRGQLAWLQEENARLRRRLSEFGLVDSPSFNPIAFQRGMRYYSSMILAPMLLLTLLPMILLTGVVSIPRLMIGPVPLIDPGGYFGIPGIGLGIVAFGGLSIGVIAIGGMACGVVAIGGGTVGLVAIGGGAIGLIAVGGGAAGYIAMGGGALGKFVLAGQGAGPFVFSLKRQDARAVEFWTHWLPRMREALTNPMPVIPVDDPKRPMPK